MIVADETTPVVTDKIEDAISPSATTSASRPQEPSFPIDGPFQGRPTKAEATLSKQCRELEFGVEKSIRYHQRRRAHYDRMHMGFMLMIILSGSAAFGRLLDSHSTWLGLLVAFLAALDLVSGVSSKARDHHFLHSRFSDLAKDIRCSVEEITASHVREWVKQRIEIEKDEKPIFWAVEASCHNELVRARGLDKSGREKIGWLQYTFMNWFRFERVG